MYFSRTVYGPLGKLKCAFLALVTPFWGYLCVLTCLNSPVQREGACLRGWYSGRGVLLHGLVRSFASGCFHWVILGDQNRWYWAKKPILAE